MVIQLNVTLAFTEFFCPSHWMCQLSGFYCHFFVTHNPAEHDRVSWRDVHKPFGDQMWGWSNTSMQGKQRSQHIDSITIPRPPTAIKLLPTSAHWTPAPMPITTNHARQHGSARCLKDNIVYVDRALNKRAKSLPWVNEDMKNKFGLPFRWKNIFHGKPSSPTLLPNPSSSQTPWHLETVRLSETNQPVSRPLILSADIRPLRGRERGRDQEQ